MTRRESLHGKLPGYRVELEPAGGVVRVRLDGELVAESRRAVLVRETRHDPVIYLPREDVVAERLEPSAHRTFCPFKGEASYWSLRAGGRVEKDVVWGYEDPFPEVAGLRDHVAFYADRVEIEGP